MICYCDEKEREKFNYFCTKKKSTKEEKELRERKKANFLVCEKTSLLEKCEKCVLQVPTLTIQRFRVIELHRKAAGIDFGHLRRREINQN